MKRRTPPRSASWGGIRPRAQIAHIGTGLRDVAGLHEQQLPGCRLAHGLLDQPHHLGDLDRLAVSDVVDVPGGRARGGVGASPTTPGSA